MRAPTDSGKPVDKHGNLIQLDLLQPSCIHDSVKHILADREVCSLSLCSYGYTFLSVYTGELAARLGSRVWRASGLSAA